MNSWKLLNVIDAATGVDCLIICERKLVWKFKKLGAIHFFYGNLSTGFFNAKTLEKMPDELYKLYIEWRVKFLVPREYKSAWLEDN